MRLSLSLSALLVVALVGCDAAGPSLESTQAAPAGVLARGETSDGQEKVAVCHYDSDTSTYELINVAAPGAEAHAREHERDYAGDYVGQDVPGMDGFVFDEACQPVQRYTVVDFGGASQAVGPGCSNCARVSKVISVEGTPLDVGVLIFDTNQASDGGYSWIAYNILQLIPSTCRYPIVAVRARAELGGTSYALEFDGYAATGLIPRSDVEGPWDRQNGDQPTLVVESVTLDLSVAPAC